MGRLVTRTILFVCIALCLVACKTRQRSEARLDQRHTWQTETLTNQMEGLTVGESTREKILSSLTGKMIFWSTPDTSGKQHKMAEMEFQGQKDSDKSQVVEAEKKSITAIVKESSGESQDQSSFKDDSQSDSRIISGERILTIMGILLLILLIGLFIKAYRERHS